MVTEKRNGQGRFEVLSVLLLLKEAHGEHRVLIPCLSATDVISISTSLEIIGAVSAVTTVGGQGWYSAVSVVPTVGGTVGGLCRRKMT